ncbi:hypothetical protein DYB38_008573 [Aphanomyces astaci]|uniref:Uncharacterized protein n=1 Tax=Aphanomyces astaci TaxID=112090 RepID=A0A397DPM8_APHAT|nr:hypothetical protein DYB38_008573 [Aphanomyces astaci]
MDINTLFGVKDQVVLITGGSRGIGKMMAEGFVRNGAKVYISARSDSVCNETAAELNAMDVSTVEGCQRLAKALGEHESKLHVLINNSGVAWGGGFDAHSAKAWSKVMDLNVTSPFFLTKFLLPLLQTHARVIMVGSIAGLQPQDLGTLAYDTSKAAIHHLTRVLAVQLAPRQITVNCIAPGLVPTKMSQQIATATGKECLISDKSLSSPSYQTPEVAPQQSAGVTDAALTTVFKSDVMLLQLKFEKLERLWGTSAKSYEPHVNAPPEAVVSIEPHGKEEALRAHIQKLQCELAHTATDLQTKHRVAENRWHRELEVLKHECAALNNTIMGLHEEVDVTKRALRHTTQELETASLKLELPQHECQRHDTTMKTLVGENEEMVNQLRDRHATATAHWTAELDGIHRRFQTQLEEVHAQQRAQQQESDERHATQLQSALDKVATLEDTTYELKELVTALTEEDDALVQRIEHWYCVTRWEVIEQLRAQLDEWTVQRGMKEMALQQSITSLNQEIACHLDCIDQLQKDKRALVQSQCNDSEVQAIDSYEEVVKQEIHVMKRAFELKARLAMEQMDTQDRAHFKQVQELLRKHKDERMADQLQAKKLAHECRTLQEKCKLLEAM